MGYFSSLQKNIIGSCDKLITRIAHYDRVAYKMLKCEKIHNPVNFFCFIPDMS